QKIAGPGGLPVGTSGKVLCLLSGGFDSVAAAYQLAKRGAQVDFLHFHVYSDAQPVLKSKITTIVNKLKEFTLSPRLYLAGYLPFQMQVLDLSDRETRQELVIFRRLMVRVGAELAKKYHYQALVLGDSLGQVASQTMENIVAVDLAVDLPIFRPLIGFDKNETINLVRQIGLEAVVNKPYKDCCSLIATHPATRADLVKIAKIETEIKIETIIKQITDNVSIING
ncbi:MAG: 7-cyano-7-deazaguanine synthase, partial [Patescibacteria group bacterium]|nr:7-cyano-7-deazaguanine synthase [Patescibacteria group bacterium]